MAFKHKHAKKGAKKNGRHSTRHHQTAKKGPTRLMVPLSRQMHQPIPDRLFTWVSINNSGYIAAGSTFVTFNIGLNNIEFPFSTGASGGGTTIPNPVVPIATLGSTGFKNLLYNTVTNTGLYKYYRCWGAKVSVTILTQALGDTGQAVLAAQANSLQYANSAAGIMQAAQGVDSVVRMIQAGSPPKDQTLKKYYRIYDLLGIPKKDYSALAATTTGSDGTGPTFPCTAFIGFRTLDQANTGQPLGIEVQIEYFVEFFTRADIALLDD